MSLEYINENRELLEQNQWVIKLEAYDTPVAYNKTTGCYVKGKLVVPFLVDKIEELLEEEITTEMPDSETLFEHYGYIVLCESPFEVENEKTKEFFKGECADWLLHNLREKWQNNK